MIVSAWDMITWWSSLCRWSDACQNSGYISDKISFVLQKV